jgi:hypothetical protein
MPGGGFGGRRAAARLLRPVTIHHVNAATGNDSNAGTSSAAAWLTLAPLRSLIAGLANGQTVRVLLIGTFVNQHLVVTNTALGTGQSATVIIDFAPDSSLTWTAGTDQSAIEPAAATAGANLRVEVNGETGTRTTISGFNVGAGNALSTGPSGTLIARWIRANDCVDGVSAHFSSSIETYDCLFENCTKSAFAHVNTAGIVRHTRDIFRGRASAVIGVGAITDTRANAYYFTDCSFEPLANDQQTTFAAAQLTRCKVGTLTVRCFLNNSAGVRPILTDCFVNLWIDGDRTATLTRCYGKLSVRMRPGGDITIEKGVFNGPATGQSSGLLFANFNAGGMGKLTVTDTILTGYTTAIGEGFSATYAGYYTASASSVTGMWGFSNTTNVHTSLVSAGAAVSVAGTTNPQLAGSANTLVQADYATGAASPCRSAGAGGSDIGFRR